MDDEAIQKGAPISPRRKPMNPDDKPYSRFPPKTHERDKRHLKILSIFFYVAAGLIGVIALLYALFVPLGIVMLLTARPSRGGSPPEDTYFIIGICSFVSVLFGIYAYGLYFAGKSLREHKRRTLILVMSILLFAIFPGVILCVFTLVVLSRESVKELFKLGDTAYPRDYDA